MNSTEISCILWHPVEYVSVHNSPKLIIILSQINQVHALRLSFLKIHNKTVFPCTPKSS
jgi:hypothetical protein